MHAFVIGVGSYPNGGRPEPLMEDLKDLTTAPLSALKVVTWLLAEQMTDPVVPLASLEVAISSSHGADVMGKKAQPATLTDVQNCFDRWYARCDESADSVAFFYFCGHGIARDRMQYALLLEDVGASALRPLENAVDFTATFEGMARCRARTQCFFIDACRDIPEALLEQTQLFATPLVTPQHGGDGRAAALVLFAAELGRKAFGQEGCPTPFSQALVQALGGLAAERRGDRWEVRADEIGPAVRRLLDWNRGPHDPSQNPRQGLGETGDALVHVLSGDPEVPFRIDCHPKAATGAAEFQFTRDGEVVQSRGPEGSRWEGRTTAGVYDLRALFRDRRFLDSVVRSRVCHPPYVEYSHQVENP